VSLKVEHEWEFANAVRIAVRTLSDSREFGVK
jgi:hypothetical protein